MLVLQGRGILAQSLLCVCVQCLLCLLNNYSSVRNKFSVVACLHTVGSSPKGCQTMQTVVPSTFVIGATKGIGTALLFVYGQATIIRLLFSFDLISFVGVGRQRL